MSLICTILISHVGCGNKILVTPIDRARFDQNYSYTINTNQNLVLNDIPGSQIQNYSDRIHITQNNETKYLLHSQVSTIEGSSNQSNGTYIYEGFTLGALGGGILTAGIIFGSTAGGECSGDDCELMPIFSSLIGLGIGGLIFGLIGMGIGAATPKKSNVLFTF